MADFLLTMSAGNAGAAQVTSYERVANSASLAHHVAEADAKIVWRTPGTFSRMHVRVLTNSTSGSNNTVRMRVNGANGNLVVTIPPASTGDFEDLTNTDTIAAGDQVNLLLTLAQANNLVFQGIGLLFTPAGTAGMRYAHDVNQSTSTASSTSYISIGGRLSFGNTEARLQYRVRAAMQLKNLYAYVTANARSTSCTLRSRVNGANGNLVATIPAGSTGTFEDTSNTDSVSSGDLVNLSFSTSTGTGSITVGHVGVEIVPTANALPHIDSADTGLGPTAGATTYSGLGGNLLTGTNSELGVKLLARKVLTFSNLQAYVSANTATASTTVAFRKNGADGNQLLTIGAGATGLFEDATNTDSVVATDYVNYRITAGTGGVATFHLLGCLATYPIDTVPRLMMLGVG